MNQAANILARAVARHGVDATLTAAGDTYTSVADITGSLKVLPRKYEASPDEKPTGLISDREKFVITAAELATTSFTTVKPYYRLAIGSFVYTIKKATPSYFQGTLVRWDVEAAGQQ